MVDRAHRIPRAAIVNSDQRRRRWPTVVLTVVLTAATLLAAGLSVPLYFMTWVGFGMSPTKWRLDLPAACLLWTPPLICMGASVGLLIRRWHWYVAAPLILLSGAEALWTLSILLDS